MAFVRHGLGAEALSKTSLANPVASWPRLASMNFVDNFVENLRNAAGSPQRLDPTPAPKQQPETSNLPRTATTAKSRGDLGFADLARAVRLAADDRREPILESLNGGRSVAAQKWVGST